MQVNQLKFPIRFHRLDITPSTISPRSCLYQLEPCAINSAYIESITSYTKRLAEAHSVTVSQLIRRKLSLVDRANIDTQALHWLGKRSAALVGPTTTASDLVQVLETATITENLQALTLLPWKEVFPSKGLTRPIQMWCPLCFTEWREKEEVIYDPLIWSFKAIAFCPIHYHPLQEYCPHCHKQNYPLDYQARAGHCSRCGQWLGQKSTTSLSLNNYLGEKRDWALWICENISDLLRNEKHLSVKLSKERVQESFNAYVWQRASGSVAAFARYLRMNQPTLQSWCSGKTLPQLEVLLKVCKRLDVKLFDFLTVDSQSINNSGNHASYTRSSRTRRAFRTPRLDLENTNRILENVLEHEYPPPPVKEVIQRIGCCSATLHKYFPDLCRAIAQRHLDYKKAERTATLRRILSQVLEDNEAPPPSLQEIAARVGMSPAVFYRFAPDLCSAISNRYLSYCQDRGTKVVEETCERVRQAVLDIHSQGIYPSSNQIMERLGDRHILRQKEFKDTWYATLQELGLKA